MEHSAGIETVQTLRTDIHLDDYLRTIARNIDPIFNVPIVPEEQAREAIGKLSPPTLQQESVFVQLRRHNRFNVSPYPLMMPSNQQEPYCKFAEGDLEAMWLNNTQTNGREQLSVKRYALIHGDPAVSHEYPDSHILFKWSDTEPTGLAFTGGDNAWIVSPVVIAVYTDPYRRKHFLYDIDRWKRTQKNNTEDHKASGFVFIARKAQLSPNEISMLFETK